MGALCGVGQWKGAWVDFWRHTLYTFFPYIPCSVLSFIRKGGWPTFEVTGEIMEKAS